jgi:hypothetical protein
MLFAAWIWWLFVKLAYCRTHHGQQGHDLILRFPIHFQSKEYSVCNTIMGLELSEYVLTKRVRKAKFFDGDAGVT